MQLTGIANWLIARAERRSPDFVIHNMDGTIYLRRWWLIPRNRFFNIYLHQILASDDDRALHDHPWWNVSIILRGIYVEFMPHRRWKYRNQGDVVFRRATASHRLALLVAPHHPEQLKPVWSLFITGPRLRDWGFHCAQGWVQHDEFTALSANGVTSKGCGE